MPKLTIEQIKAEARKSAGLEAIQIVDNRLGVLGGGLLREIRQHFGIIPEEETRNKEDDKREAHIRG